MTTKLVTVRLTEQAIEQVDRIVAKLNQMSFKGEDEIAAPKYTRSHVLRVAVDDWLKDHQDAIADL